MAYYFLQLAPSSRTDRWEEVNQSTEFSRAKLKLHRRQQRIDHVVRLLTDFGDANQVMILIKNQGVITLGFVINLPIPIIRQVVGLNGQPLLLSVLNRYASLGDSW